MSSSASKPQAKRPRQKRGPTGYGLFAKAQSPQLKEQHPDWTFAETSRHVATLWKAESESKKKQWQEEAATMKASMKATIPVEPVVEKGSKKRKRKNDRSSEPKPKRALSTYMYFAKENRADIKDKNPNATFAELAGLVSRDWKELTEDGKKPYQAMADKDKQRYQEEKGSLSKV